MPGLDVVANYNVIGYAGTQFVFGEGFPPPVVDQSVRSFSSALRDVFGQDFRTWSVALNFSYPLGTSQADAAAHPPPPPICVPRASEKTSPSRPPRMQPGC